MVVVLVMTVKLGIVVVMVIGSTSMFFHAAYCQAAVRQ